MCIKPGTYTDRALRKAVKGLLPQGGSPIAVLVFVSALTSLICWGRGTRGNEAKLETTLTKVMRTRRDGHPPLPLPVSSGGGVSEIPSVFSLPSFLLLSLPVEKKIIRE